MDDDDDDDDDVCGTNATTRPRHHDTGDGDVGWMTPNVRLLG
jgi:hypothetical protein